MSIKKFNLNIDIEAVQYDGSEESYNECVAFAGDLVGSYYGQDKDGTISFMATGVRPNVACRIGDWIVKENALDEGGSVYVRFFIVPKSIMRKIYKEVA